MNVRFVNSLDHTEALVDGREVGPYGEFELSADQYKNPEQWRRIADGMAVGASAAADKLIEEAKADPAKYDVSDVAPLGDIKTEEATP